MEVATGGIKDHLHRYKTAYSIGAGIIIGVSVAVLAGHIMKKSFISSELLGTASSELLGTGKRMTSFIFNPSTKGGDINVQQIIEALRPGPPSWVVRCLETGEVFSSQRAAAIANDLAESDLSRHLNGLRELREGLHFERICMAA